MGLGIHSFHWNSVHHNFWGHPLRAIIPLRESILKRSNMTRKAFNTQLHSESLTRRIRFLRALTIRETDPKSTLAIRELRLSTLGPRAQKTDQKQ